MKNNKEKTIVNRLVRLILVTVLIITFSNSAKSQQSGFGVGIMFGEPSGISFKGWLAERSAIDGGVGWSFVNNGSVHIHADYLYHFNVFGSANVPVYLGVGGRIKMKNTGHNTDTRIGVRVPVGISYQFTEAPIDIFVEVAPLLDLNPKTEGSVNGAVGIRYYLK